MTTREEKPPPLMETLLEHGYQTRSGNRVHLMVATKPGERRVWAAATWEKDASAEDKREFEQILESCYHVQRGPDLAGRKSVFEAVRQFFEKPS